jgi:hypothetical protein
VATSLLNRPTILSVVVTAGLLLGLGVYSLIGDPAIEMHVGPGLSPTISWKPPQGFSTIQVLHGEYEPGRDFDSSQVMWWIEVAEGQQIHSPIEYGAPVPGARVIQGPRALVDGHTYTAYLYLATDNVSGDANIHEVTETFIARE